MYGPVEVIELDTKDYVRRDYCEMRMQHAKEERNELRDRVQRHGIEIDGVREIVNRQTSTIESIAARLESVDARLKHIEERPKRRWEAVLDTVINWATLAILALLAAKIGF